MLIVNNISKYLKSNGKSITYIYKIIIFYNKKEFLY